MRALPKILAMAVALVFGAAPLHGQSVDFSGQVMDAKPAASILVLNQERLLRDSTAGQQVLAAEQSLRAAHQAEGARLDEELEAEERELAELRETLPVEEFQELAIAFDAKVVRIRQDHVGKSESLSLKVETARKEFFAQIVPIVAGIMEERGASLVFEQRNILFTGPGVDITDEVIRRIDNSGAFE